MRETVTGHLPTFEAVLNWSKVTGSTDADSVFSIILNVPFLMLFSSVIRPDGYSKDSPWIVWFIALVILWRAYMS
jgi:hypothetical protein